MAKTDSFDRVLKKLNELETRLSEFEAMVTVSLVKLEGVIDDAPKRPKKAKDLPVGTKVTVYGLGNEREADDIYEVIAHSKTCDDVVIVENDSGDITAENVNDLDIVRD